MRVGSRKDLHQRGFPGTIFTHQTVDGPLSDLERHIVQSDDTGEAFGHAPHLQQVWFAHCYPTTLLRVGLLVLSPTHVFGWRLWERSKRSHNLMLIVGSYWSILDSARSLKA